MDFSHRTCPITAWPIDRDNYNASAGNSQPFKLGRLGNGTHNLVIEKAQPLSLKCSLWVCQNHCRIRPISDIEHTTGCCSSSLQSGRSLWARDRGSNRLTLLEFAAIARVRDDGPFPLGNASGIIGRGFRKTNTPSRLKQTLRHQTQRAHLLLIVTLTCNLLKRRRAVVGVLLAFRAGRISTWDRAYE